jgi:tetratricopeptide (TPR) repeat protein
VDVADIFVSYTSSDREWAFWIGHELDALGHVPHIHDWEIPAGGDIVAWMEERHQAADHILCVISAAYLSKPHSSWERRTAQWAAITDRQHFLLPIFIEPCKTPTLLATLKRCDLYGLEEADARARLNVFLAPAVKSPRGIFPGAPKPSFASTNNGPHPFPSKGALSNIPIGVPLHFMGRDDALSAIETALDRFEGRVAITALHGLRGIGKTTLAAAYAHRHRGDYRVTWWIRAQTEPEIRADLVALGIRLGWIGVNNADETAVKAVMERLRDEGEGVLLIFDNAIDASALKPYIPLGGAARVLVTSNSHAWRGVASPVEIRLWPRDIGAAYLLVRTGREAERTAAEALSEALGGLPLAHEQAAAYCEQLDISLADYRKRFETTPGQYLGDAGYAPAEYHDGLTVAKTFELAIDEAAKRHPAAEPLIVYAALLAPEPVPLFLFGEARDTFGEPLALMLAEDGLDKAVAALRVFGLVDRERIVDERDASITTDAIRLHRLVREVAAARCQGEARVQMRRAVTAALAAVYPRTRVWRTPTSWPRCALLTPHVLSVCQTETVDAAMNPECARLLNRAGEYFQGLAAYSQARSLYERALPIAEKVLGSEHPDTATNLNNLGWALYDQRDLEGSRSLFERALAIRETALGPEHSDTADSLNDLGWLLYKRGDLVKARPLFERALAIREKVRGPEHPQTAESLNNLSRLLGVQGDLSEARVLNERALVIFEKALGPEHPETAASVNFLGALLYRQGDIAGARPLFERALAIREKILGPEHPETATSLNNVGSLLYRQGDIAGARPLFERALAIREKVLGPKRFELAESLNNLARLLWDEGDPVGAHPLYERASAIYEKVLGPEHPDTNRVRAAAAACRRSYQSVPDNLRERW